MTERVSRRAAMAAGLSAAAGLASCSRKAADDDGGGENRNKWAVGQIVLPKKPDPFAADPALGPEGEAGEAGRTVDGASWEVKAEKGTRVEVFDTNGSALWIQKDLLVPLADAVEFYTKEIKDDATDAYAYNSRGWAQYLLGKPDDALKDFSEFLKLAPGPGAAGPRGAPKRAIGLSNRGLVLAETGKFDAALKDLDEALTTGYGLARVNRGWAYELKGDYDKAAKDFTTAVEWDAGDLLAVNNIAWLRATCPDAAFRDGKEAVKLAKLACDRTGNREGNFLDTLAAAHAETGDFAAAVKAQELAMGDAGYMRKYGDDAQKRLRLYKDKKPYRSEPVK